MARAFTLLFAVVAYGVFFATFLYLIAFVGDLPFVPVTVDAGPTSAPAVAVLIDLALIALFGVQHSVMARQGFKRWWTQFVPQQAERSVYVLASSVALIVLYALWRPLTAIVWSVDGMVANVLWATFALGWALVLASTFLINHFELFGLQQAWFHASGRNAAAPEFRQPLFYKLVRHPLYLGFLIAFWAIPTMTLGHLLFAGAMTAWMLMAIQLEERDLVDLFGDKYRHYKTQVGMLLPKLFGR